MKTKWVILIIVGAILVGAYYQLDLEKKELDDSVWNILEGDTAPLSAGITYYQYASDNNGPIVVLVHGFSTPSYIWDPTYKFLQQNGYRVLRYDLCGRGYSERPDADYGLDFLVQQLQELLEHLNIANEPIHLVGLSLGGPIVGAYSNQNPEHIQSLTLIDPYTQPASSSEVFPMNVPVIGEFVARIYLVPFMLPNSQADDFHQPEHFPGWEELYREQLQYTGFRRAILATIRNMVDIAGIQEYEKLNDLDIPTLLLWGEEDRSIPYQDMQLIQDVLPEVEFHAIPQSGHLPHYEQASQVNNILQDFFNSVHR